MKRVNDKTRARNGRKANPQLICSVLIACFAGLILSADLSARPSSGAELRFAVVGDLMGHKEQIESAYDPKCKCYDYGSVFADTAPILQKADLAIGNLEVTLPGKPELYKGYPQFGSPDAYANAMKEAGFDILTLANNHCVDTGKAGLLRTLKTVRDLGLVALGTFASKKEYTDRPVAIVEKNGFRVALLNYTYGTNGIPVPPGVHVNLIRPEQIRSDLRKASLLHADIKIVLFHFGQEYQRQASQYQKAMVDVAINAGADIVLGGHPHVLQPFEKRMIRSGRGRARPVLVAYSLGNFVSHQIRRYTDGGMIFQFTVMQSNDGLVIKDIGYEPVLVYIDHSEKRPQYRVLPVSQYLYFEKGKVKRKPDPPRALSKAGWSRMVTFFEDTTGHLQKSTENVSP
ncbi:MAG: CapA family protein [Leptospiraceae bacterium]|nr:CapA family protein [Leptospiraceae bacterium]